MTLVKIAAAKKAKAGVAKPKKVKKDEKKEEKPAEKK